MKKENKLVINTRVNTKQAEADLKSLVAAVNKTLNAVGPVGSAIIGTVVGQIGEIINIKNIIKYLKEAIDMAMKAFAGSKFVEQFKGISKVFEEKLANLKMLVGQAVIPICSMLMTLGNSVVDFFAAVSAVVGGLTGKLVDPLTTSGSAAANAAKGQTALAKATVSAGTAAKGTLAAFDELNVLEQKKDGGGGGSGSKPEKPEKPEIPEIPEIPEGGGLFDFLKQLIEALEPLTEELFAGLQWGYENVLQPLGEWAGNELIPSFLGALSGAAGAVAAALDVLKPLGLWLWESFLQPLGQWSGEIAIIALDGLAKAFEAVSLWIEENKEKLASIWETVEPLFTLISEFVLDILNSIKEFFGLWIDSMSEMLTGMLDFWLGLITGDWELMWQGLQTMAETGKELLLGTFGILWESIKSGFGKCWEAVKLLWAPVGDWFMQNVMSPIQKNFGWLWDGIVLAGKIAWQMVLGIWESLSQWFMDTVVTPISGIVQKLWSDISTAFKAGLDHIRGMLTEYVNLCLEMFEGGANMLISLFNKIIDALNSISVEIPDWVPEYGGKSFGISIPKLSPISIPRLATGAVIPPNSQFAAILGDQRSGRNLEAPEGLIREIVREESGAREIVVRFEGSMAQLARVLAPAIQQENARQGTRLVIGGA